MNKNYYELKKQIFERFLYVPVESYGNITSLDTVSKAIQGMDTYNYIFLKETRNDIKKFNISNGYTKCRKNNTCPKLVDIEFSIEEYGRKQIDFIALDNDKISTTSIYNKNGDEYSIIGNKLDASKQYELISNLKTKFSDKITLYFDLLKEFEDEFPALPYKWSITDPYIERYYAGDDFLKLSIDLNNPDESHVTFSNIDDSVLASNKYNHEILYDYIEMYNNELARKTPVDITTLDPVTQRLTKKYIKKTKEVHSTIQKSLKKR